MPTRNSDSRFRNHNKPTVVSADSLRAQWVEMEAMRLKRNAFSYEAIAEHNAGGPWARSAGDPTAGRHPLAA